MAGYVLDDTAPPPELLRGFDYKGWGVNVLDLPPGEVRAISQAMNAYSALSAYRRAAARGKTADWTESNPEAWEFVAGILAERMKRRSAADGK